MAELFLVKGRCRVCLRLERLGHSPRCPADPVQAPEWIEIADYDGTPMGSVTIWSREDLQAPFNRRRRSGD